MEKEISHLRMQHPLIPQMLQGALTGTFRVRRLLRPQRNLSAQAHRHRGPAMRVCITHPVMGLQQQGCGQQAGRHAAPSIVPIMEAREILIPK